MLAESVHSLADTANQALLLLGSHLGKKSDPVRHPLGRSAEVYFWAFVVALTGHLMVARSREALSAVRVPP